jgi:Spy/CpxP family protein refolding chaperone
MSNTQIQQINLMEENMKKLISYSLIVIFAFATVISAQQAKEKDESKCGQPGCKKLNLTPEQERQFKDIKYEQQKKAIDLRSDLEKNRLEIKHMVTTNNIDEKKILDLIDANSKIQAELKKSDVQSWLVINKILTAEQKEIWVKHFDDFGCNMRERMRDKMMPRKEKMGDNMKPMGREGCPKEMKGTDKNECTGDSMQTPADEFEMFSQFDGPEPEFGM